MKFLLNKKQYNKPTFNNGLFVEALKQTRLCTFLLLFLYLLLGIYFILTIKDIAYRIDIDYMLDSIDSLMPGFVFITVVFAIVMANISFGIFDKRKKCDFYAALPFTPKERLFTSFVALLTQMAFCIFCASVILTITGLCFKFEIDFLCLFLYQTFLFCTFFAVISSIYLGIAFTKNNVMGIISGLLFNALYFVFEYGFCYSFESALWEGSNRYVSFSRFYNERIYFIDFSYYGYLIKYSIILILLGILFACLGLLIYKKTGYENKSTVKSQTFFNFLCGFAPLVTLIALISYRAYEDFWDNHLSTFIIGLLFAALATFLAHVFTKKSFNKIKCVAVAFGFNLLATLVSVVLFIGAFYLGVCAVKNHKITAVSIPQITIINQNSSVEYHNTTSYQQLVASKISIRDPELLDYINKNQKHFSKVYTSNIAIYIKSNIYYSAIASFYLNKDEMNQLFDLIMNNPKYINAYLTIEKPNKNISVALNGSTDKQQEFYNSFYEEFSLLSIEDKKHIVGTNYLDPYPWGTQLEENEVFVTVKNTGNEPYVSTYILSSKLMPQTYSQYAKYLK